ncbi:MAG: multicopper oxidase family protein, partial [Bryobacteraceae bacterium]
MRSSVDANGLTRYCYIYKNAVDAPTVRLHPGDEFILRLKNDLGAPGGATAADAGSKHVHHGCGGGPMTITSTNLHFHGLTIPPVCHQDETIRTLIGPSSAAFEYRFRIPATESPGLYWYHPHPHGFSEAQVLGGASGALIVEGIEREKPEVAGLPERVLILRDALAPGLGDADEDSGAGKDISLNFVPVMYPLYRPAQLSVRPGEREFWRVLNASADTFFDVQVRVWASLGDARDPLPLTLIARDGVAATDETRTHVLLPPGARAEFIVTTPAAGMSGQLVTLPYDTGRDGTVNPFHALANIVASKSAPAAETMPAAAPAAREWQFTGLTNLIPVRTRTLYFSEAQQNPNYPAEPATYFITVEGAKPKAFDMNFKKPDIVARQGTIEDWIVENRAQEAHTFHIHQIHFQLLERDGHKVNEQALRDTVDLPYWDGKSAHYPRVRLRMDFR